MAVALVSAGGGNRATGSATNLATSWSHTVASSDPTTVVLIGVVQSVTSNAAPTAPTVTYGSRGASHVRQLFLGTSTSRASVHIFAVWNPPTGAQTVTVTGTTGSTKAAIAGQSVAYNGVRSLGLAVTATATSVSVSSDSSGMVFGAHSNGAALTASSGTDRYNAGSSVNGVGDYIRVQDAAGTGASVSLSVTGTATTPGSIGISLRPYTAPSGTQRVLRDASSQAPSSSPTSTSPMTWSHTCAGSNRALLVQVYGGSGMTVTGVTYNGVAMTLLGNITSLIGQPVYLYGLLNPASGANSVSVSFTGTLAEAAAGSYSGVDSFGTVDTDNTSGMSGLAVTAPANGMAVAAESTSQPYYTTAQLFSPRDWQDTTTSVHLADAYGTGSSTSFALASAYGGIAVVLPPATAVTNTGQFFPFF